MDRPIDPKQRRLHRVIFAMLALAVVGAIGVMLSTQTELLGGTMTVDELSKHVGQDPYHYVVLDVRSPEAFATGHIPFAISMPGNQIGRRLGELNDARERQIVIVGNGADDALAAAKFLRQGGFPSVLYVAEGISAWTASGRALDTANDSPMHKLVQ